MQFNSGNPVAINNWDYRCWATCNYEEVGMYCTACGRPNGDAVTFCVHCGQRLSKGADSSSASAKPPMEFSKSSRAYTPAGQSPAAQANVRQQPSGTRGCFGSGWDDVTKSPNLLKRLLLMALIQFVPILNWVNYGYAYNWGKDVALGKRNPIPTMIVTGENFKTGAIIFLLQFICALALSVQSYLFVLVFNSVNQAIAIALTGVLSVFMAMFLNLALMRSALFNSLGSGFSVGKIMRALGKKMGTAFCVLAVPALVVGGIVLLLGLVFGLIMLVVVMAAAAGAVSLGGVANANVIYAAIAGNAGIAALTFILYLVAGWLGNAAGMFGVLITARSTGHYVSRYAVDWLGELDVERAAAAYRESSSYGDGDIRPADASAVVAPQSASNEVRPSTSAAGSTTVGAENRVSPARERVVETVVARPEYSETIVSETTVGDTRVGETILSSDMDSYRNNQTVVASEEDAAGYARTAHQEEATTRDASGGATAYDNARTEYAPASINLIRSNGAVCTISGFPATIGKSEEADVCIDDNPRISRIHARILEDSGVFAVEDLGSTNRTYVQGYLVEQGNPTILSDGDELKLGNEVLRVRFL